MIASIIAKHKLDLAQHRSNIVQDIVKKWINTRLSRGGSRLVQGHNIVQNERPKMNPT